MLEILSAIKAHFGLTKNRETSQSTQVTLRFTAIEPARLDIAQGTLFPGDIIAEPDVTGGMPAAFRELYAVVGIKVLNTRGGTALFKGYEAIRVYTTEKKAVERLTDTGGVIISLDNPPTVLFTAGSRTIKLGSLEDPRQLERIKSKRK